MANPCYSPMFDFLNRSVRRLPQGITPSIFRQRPQPVEQPVIQPKITLFDIPTVIPNKPNSPNTWKVRLALNYKNLPYTTTWVPIVDIASTCKTHGISPTATLPDGSPHYTLPALIDSTTEPPTVISDSLLIVEYLDRTYPSATKPPLTTPSTHALNLLLAHYLFEKLLASPTAFPLLTMDILERKLPADSERHRVGLQAYLGVPVEAIVGDYADPGEVGEAKRNEGWAALGREFDTLAGFIGSEERWFGGEDIGFGDLAVAAVLIYLVETGKGGEGKVREWSGGRWGRFLDRMQEYVKVK